MSQALEASPLYAAARKLRQRVFKLVEKLPKQDRYVLHSQLRRGVMGVTGGVAEALAGDQWKQNALKLGSARSSLNALLDALHACEDAGFFKAAHLDDLRGDVTALGEQIDAAIADQQQRLKAYRASKPAGNRGGRSSGGGRPSGGGGRRYGGGKPASGS
jgi:four helix bundle protein